MIGAVSLGASDVSEAAAPHDGESAVVRIEALGKSFPVRRPVRRMLMSPRAQERTRVLDKVSFTVGAGEFLGLLGPNGAGKTTLLKILATLVLPDDGSASVAGHDVRRHGAAVRDAVSLCLASERSLFLRLSASENLRVAADLAGIPQGEVQARIIESLDAVGLSDTGGKMSGQFSSGMLQRLLIARALLTRPKLLMLDEPTRSLDPISARDFRHFLRHELAARRGCAVIIATHNAEEAISLCDRVAVMNRGRMLAVGPAEELSRRFLGARYRIAVSVRTAAVLRDLERPDLFTRVREEPSDGSAQTLVVRLDDGVAPSTLLQALVLSGAEVSRFEVLQPDLAELISSVMTSSESA